MSFGNGYSLISFLETQVSKPVPFTKISTNEWIVCDTRSELQNMSLVSREIRNGKLIFGQFIYSENCSNSINEWVNSGLTPHQQRGHTETGPRFKVSSERPEKRGIDLATPGLVV